METPASLPSPAEQPILPEPSTWWQKTLSYIDKNRRVVILLAILFVVVDIGIFIFYQNFRDKSSFSEFFSRSKSEQTSSSPSPTPSGTPKPIGTGLQTAKFSHGKLVIGPKLGTVTLDPIDPAIGTTQTIAATIKHDSPVTSATIHLYSDNKTEDYPLKLTDGTATDGTWQAQIKYRDSINYNYYIKFDLQSSTGNYNGGLRLRQ